MKLPDFQIERFFARYEFNTELLLCASDCQSMSVSELCALEPGARERLSDLWLGYTESRGAPSLRGEISRLYRSITAGEVLVHAGAEEGIHLCMHAVLEPGDHVIVQSPCYQSLREIALGTGCEVSPWSMREEDGWAPDPDELDRLVRPSTKLIVVNTPHNPTGYHLPEGVLRRLCRIADERRITLFCDEVYRGLEYRDEDRIPSACDLSERAVSLGVLSKAYGLGGLRIGWMATRDQVLYARMESLKDYTTICSSAPSELLAEIALRHGESIIGRNLGLIRANLSLVGDLLRRHPDLMSWQPPKAGPIAFPRLLRGTIGELSARIAKECGVLLLPGTVYGDRENHFRIGFGRANLPQALARLEEWLSRNRD
ncbi:MAG TPA: aminotransferase class I/II-fold pyridoxal phosphate-dependent enzyme [Spirochaetia bacterium]|nr:aminotransferase class I/II-fold pyridoxal phosphate-dependent enzyme [Spirochaetia bacterium]